MSNDSNAEPERHNNQIKAALSIGADKADAKKNYPTVVISFMKEKYNLKSTGIVRKVDELGRIVLPIELRRTLGIEEKDSLDIFIDGNNNEPGCIFWGSLENIGNENGKPVCGKCRKEIAAGKMEV